MKDDRAPKQQERATVVTLESEAKHGDVVYMAKPLDRDAVLSGYTYKLKWPGSDHAIYVTINDIERDGRLRPFEIFINTKNLEHYAWTVALTRMISAVFRRGGDVAFVAEELKAVFDPEGGRVDRRQVCSERRCGHRRRDRAPSRTHRFSEYCGPAGPGTWRTARQVSCGRWAGGKSGASSSGSCGFCGQEMPAVSGAVAHSRGQLLDVCVLWLFPLRLDLEHSPPPSSRAPCPAGNRRAHDRSLRSLHGRAIRTFVRTEVLLARTRA